MATSRQTTPEGDAILAEALREAEASPPKDTAPVEDPAPAGDAPKRRGRPPGSRNTGAGRKPRAAKLDAVDKAFGTAIERGTMLAQVLLMKAPMHPDKRLLYINDAQIIASDDGKAALVGSLRVACEKNARIARFCENAIEVSAYTGIGATVLFGLVLPIAMNHGLIKLPPALLATMAAAGDAEPEAE